MFENLENMCPKIYELDPVIFLSGPGLVWQSALKKSKVKSDPLADIDVINGTKSY